MRSLFSKISGTCYAIGPRSCLISYWAVARQRAALAQAHNAAASSRSGVARPPSLCACLLVGVGTVRALNMVRVPPQFSGMLIRVASGRDRTSRRAYRSRDRPTIYKRNSASIARRRSTRRCSPIPVSILVVIPFLKTNRYQQQYDHQKATLDHQ